MLMGKFHMSLRIRDHFDGRMSLNCVMTSEQLQSAKWEMEQLYCFGLMSEMASVAA
jgi:hypothetical protein